MSRARAAWADEMRQLFRAGSTSQFMLYGGVDDLVPGPEIDGRPSFASLRRFLTEVMFEPFDVVIHYDRGRGIRVPKGGEPFPPFPEGVRRLPGHQLGQDPRPRCRRHGPRPGQPAAAGSAPRARADQPLRARQPVADRRRRGGPPGGGAAQGGGAPRLRPLHRPQWRRAAPVRRTQPGPDPASRVGERSGHPRRLRRHASSSPTTSPT